MKQHPKAKEWEIVKSAVAEKLQPKGSQFARFYAGSFAGGKVGLGNLYFQPHCVVSNTSAPKDRMNYVVHIPPQVPSLIPNFEIA